MEPLYKQDLAYIQATGFGAFAQNAAPEIIRRLKCAAIPVKKVTDVGCGAGPLAEALVNSGFEVIGIDGSAELVAHARAAVPKAHFIHGSIYDTQIPSCQAIVALGETLTYHSEDTDADSLIEKFFQTARDVLPPGGLLIFDVIELTGPSLAGRYWSSGEDWAVMAETEEDQRSRTLVRHIETSRRIGQSYRRGREVHRVRLFDPAKLCYLLEACGFSTETAQTYGARPLPPRRRAFFSTRTRIA